MHVKTVTRTLSLPEYVRHSDHAPMDQLELPFIHHHDSHQFRLTEHRHVLQNNQVIYLLETENMYMYIN